jgi:oligopeptide/dipeptide ABC transporter ATP-binding protein
MAGSPLLEVDNLQTHFYTSRGTVLAVDGVSLALPTGSTLGVVGESGCGKSITALSILRLVPSPPGQIVSGKIIFEGEDLLQKTKSEMQELRGNRISMIYQDPMTSLNPVYTIGNQIGEVMVRHKNMGKSEAKQESIRLLGLVGIPTPERRVDDYPHQLSGGMRQRAMIAMALACKPQLLIADEPTTALDVTIQAQILDLMKTLQQEFGMAIMLITHDLGIVAEFVDYVVVMYAGRVVEEADTKGLFRSPKHPYTRGLLASIPRLDVEWDRLQTIEGKVPTGLDIPKGCRFNPRCTLAEEVCALEEPDLRAIGPTHKVRCRLA